MKNWTGTMVYDIWGNEGCGLLGMVIERKVEGEFDDWRVEWYHKHHIITTVMSRGSLAKFIIDYKRLKKNI